MRYIKVYEGDAGWLLVHPEHSNELHSALRRYLDTGRDTLVEVVLLGGEEYAMRASRITGLLVSTPEARLRSVEIERDLKAEHQQHRQAAGVWDEEHDGE